MYTRSKPAHTSWLGQRGQLLAAALCLSIAPSIASAEPPPPIPPGLSTAAYGIAPSPDIPPTTTPLLSTTYDLHLPDSRAWQHSSIALRNPQQGPSIEGQVFIDLSIGPQARVPTPDEIVHVLPFVAAPVPGTTSTYAFEVTVGVISPQKYQFTFSVCPSADKPCSEPPVEEREGTDGHPKKPNTWLVGEVSIGGLSARSFHATLTEGTP